DGNIECIELWDMDSADLRSVKNFADKFIKEVGILNVIYSNELYRRLKGSSITSIACHLGFISTNIGPEGFIRNFVMMLARSPDIGAINVMYPALDPNIDEGEKYFEDCKEVKPNDQALDEELAKKF
ncbi:20942_t:CDS:2, partial [Gigaspora margarita]